MKFYCPACGEESDIEAIALQPTTELEIICPKCETEFTITIEFVENEST